MQLRSVRFHFFWVSASFQQLRLPGVFMFEVSSKPIDWPHPVRNSAGSAYKKIRRAAALLAVAAVASFLPTVASAADTAGDCRIGAYRLTDGTVVDIGASDDDALRWRRADGTTGALHKNADGNWTSTLGWTEKRDGKTAAFSDCAKGEISFDGINGHRIAFDVTETEFNGLVGSSQYMLGAFGPDSDLRRYGLRLCERGGKNAKKRAVVAVARKLAVLLDHLWVTGDEYEPLHHAGAETRTAPAAA